jgi:hypothetical protein
MWRWAWLGLLLATAPAFAEIGDILERDRSASHVRIGPNIYTGSRGTEPNEQLVALLQQYWSNDSKRTPWEVKLHLEVECQGARDVSVDVDRAWLAIPVGGEPHSAPSFYLGRIHPWDLSHHPAATDPWGLLAQRSPQNRGLLLGYGYSPDETEANPIILGWIGAHFWSPKGPFKYGFSFSPIFIPSMGSEVTVSESGPASARRFARRPPGYIDLNGRTHPLRLAVDRSRLWQDVLLQPQLAAQGALEISPDLEIWATVSRAPAPDPSYTSDGYLKVSDTDIEGVATIHPLFVQRWDFSLSPRWRPGLPLNTAVVGAIFGSTDHSWGSSLGIENRFFDFSLLHEASVGMGGPSYSDLLAQGHGRVAIGDFEPFAGFKTHLRTSDAWLNGGVRYAMTAKTKVELGTDVFSGGANSYFGEWRANDRVYLVVQWRVDE